MLPPLNGTDERLDALIALQRETLEAIKTLREPVPAAATPNTEQIELREPETAPKRPKKS